MWEMILSHIVDIICTLMLAGITMAQHKLQKKNQKVQEDKEKDAELRKNEVDAIKALVKYTIHKEAEYRNRLDYCPSGAKQDVADMYEPYEAMGGNGIGKIAYESIINLPEVPPSEKPVA